MKLRSRTAFLEPRPAGLCLCTVTLKASTQTPPPTSKVSVGPSVENVRKSNLRKQTSIKQKRIEFFAPLEKI